MDSSPQWIWQCADWPHFRVDLNLLMPLLSQARRAQGILLGKAQSIGLQQLPAAENAIWIDEALATAAIEGENLNLDAVRSSVGRRLGLAAATPSGAVSRNVEGLLDCMADACNNWDQTLTMETLFGWQAALFPAGFSSIFRVKTGALRDEPIAILSGPIGRERVHYQAPDPERLAADMAVFLDWFEASRHAAAAAGAGGPSPFADGLLRAALAHLWFEVLHPFEDGNGRVGRALIDRVLAQDTRQPSKLFGLARQLMRSRDDYYLRLETASKGGMDITEWCAWFIGQLCLACGHCSTVLDGALQKAQFWAKFSGIALSPAQRKCINLLLDAGPQGFAGGMSTAKYVSINKVSTATASRDLGALQKWGLLAVSGQGKATRYWVDLDGWR
jgi:Fic family protein